MEIKNTYWVTDRSSYIADFKSIIIMIILNISSDSVKRMLKTFIENYTIYSTRA